MDKQANPSLSQRAVLGAGWLMAGKLLSRGCDGIVLIVLARLLSPSDFGLVALAMTLVYIVESVFELPVAQVLVRQRELVRVDLDTAFTLSLLRGCTVVLVMLALSLPYARFTAEPRLVPLVSTLALAPFFRGLISPAMVRFIRALDFRPNFVFEIAAKLIGGTTAVTIAWTTRSYWALAAGTVAGPVVMATLSFIVAPYRPNLSLRSWPIFSHILSWNFVAQLLTSGNWQFDRILLGRLASTADLGRFAISSDVAGIAQQAVLAPAVQSLSAAMYANGEDRERIRSMYLKASNALVLVGAPIFVGLALLADPAVRLLLGPQWHDAGPLLAKLAFANLPILPTQCLSAALFARRQGQWFSLMCAIELAMRIPTVTLATLAAGVEGTAWARIAMAFAMLIAGMCVARVVLGVGFRAQIAAVLRPALAVATMGLPLIFLVDLVAGQPSGPVLWLAVAAVSLVGATIYVAMVFLLWFLAGRPDGLEATAMNRIRALLGKITARAVRT